MLISRLLCVGLAVLSLASSAHAVPVLVTTRAGQGANDLVDWAQFGPENTLVASGAIATSVLGTAVTVTEPGSFYRFQQRGDGFTWAGNFVVGDSVLYTGHGFPGGGVGPMTFSFSSPVAGAGFNFQNNSVGAFQVQIEAFDILDNSLGAFTENGNSAGIPDNSAIYIGVRDTSFSISKITVTSLTNPGNNGLGQEFAINQMSLNSSAPEIDPGSAAAAVGVMFFAWGLLDSRRRVIRREA